MTTPSPPRWTSSARSDPIRCGTPRHPLVLIRQNGVPGTRLPDSHSSPPHPRLSPTPPPAVPGVNSHARPQPDRDPEDPPREGHPTRPARRRRSTTARSRPTSWSSWSRSPRVSDNITVERRDDDDRRPSFAINRVGTDVSVRFAGIPLGHEFTSLVLALLQVGGHPSTASAETVRQIEELDGDYHFETYFSLSCQNCPDVVQALNLMSVLNPRITHTAIDGALFQDEVDDRGVMAVPYVLLNGEPFDQGRMTLEQIVAKLDTGSSAEREAAKDRREGPVRGARRGRRSRRSLGGDLRRPEGHPHRHRRGAIRRPGARHHGDRELRLGALHRRPERSRPRSSSTSRSTTSTS